MTQPSVTPEPSMAPPPGMTHPDVRPFSFTASDEALADLRRHLAAIRWPHRELVTDRSQGVQLATMRQLAAIGRRSTTGARCEAKLNALPQFITEIDGVDIYFIHVRSPQPNAFPLIITHGWPGSVIEMLGVIGPLTNPTAYGGRAEDAFDLVIPSLPGYGFSGRADRDRLERRPHRARLGGADARLGYTRTSRRAATVGSAVTDAMGRQAPAGLLGIHMNLLADGAERHGAPAGGIRRGARGARRDRRVQHERLGLLPGAGHAATDDRLRPAGFTGRPGGLDARPRHR